MPSSPRCAETFEQSGMSDDHLAALVEEVREDNWREEHGRPSKAT